MSNHPPQIKIERPPGKTRAVHTLIAGDYCQRDGSTEVYVITGVHNGQRTRVHARALRSELSHVFKHDTQVTPLDLIQATFVERD